MDDSMGDSKGVKKDTAKRPRVGLILAAGGVGSRFGGELPKQFAPLGMGSVLRLAGSRLLSRWEFADLVVTAPPGFESRTALELSRLGRTFNVVTGGKERWESIRHGLEALAEVEIVVVHDAARPLITRRVLRECIAAARDVGAALAALPAVDTVKLAAEGSLVERTLDRRRVWLAQTPQCARYDLLKRCYAQHDDVLDEATDDAALVEALGEPVSLVPGSPQLFKITGAVDLAYAEYLLARGRLED